MGINHTEYKTQAREDKSYFASKAKEVKSYSTGFQAFQGQTKAALDEDGKALAAVRTKEGLKAELGRMVRALVNDPSADTGTLTKQVDALLRL